jgi:hypothetical protein
LLLAFAETLEFLGDAVLDLELEGLGAGGVRLLCKMCMSKKCVVLRSYHLSGGIQLTSEVDWRASTRLEENWTGELLRKDTC